MNVDINFEHGEGGGGWREENNVSFGESFNIFRRSRSVVADVDMNAANANANRERAVHLSWDVVPGGRDNPQNVTEGARWRERKRGKREKKERDTLICISPRFYLLKRCGNRYRHITGHVSFRVLHAISCQLSSTFSL